MKKTTAKTDPGQFEQLVLTPVLLLSEQAYGTTVHAKVEELSERRIRLPAVYVTLDRFVEKGYLKSWTTEPTATRGGRSRRCFRLLAEGDHVLAKSAAISKRLYDAWRIGKRKPVAQNKQE